MLTLNSSSPIVVPRWRPTGPTRVYARLLLARSQTPPPFSKDWANQSGLRSRSSTIQTI